MTVSRTDPLRRRQAILDQMQRYYATVPGRARRMFYGARRRATEKGLSFEITIEHIVLALINGHCQRTGIRFEIDTGSSLLAPSIDRIDSALGYTVDNVQYVCCAYNMGKKHMTDVEYEAFVLMAAQYHHGRDY